MVCLPAASALTAANLRRRAEHHGIDRRTIVQQLIERGEMRQIRMRGMATGDRCQRHAICRCYSANMLIARDLAEAHNGNPDRTHC
jgi:hypothetical protein